MFYKRSNTATISKYLFTLPYSSVGLVIGHRGSTIKRINRESGAFCMFDRKRSSYNQRVFSVSGEIHQIDYAVKAIQSLLNVVLELHYDGSTIIFKQSEKLDKKKPTGYRNLKSTYQPMQQQFGYHQPLYIFDNNSPMLNNNTYHSIQKQVDKDYSLEWIHYYRNLGNHHHADLIEDYVRNRNTENAKKWANYYRSIGYTYRAIDIKETLKKQQESGLHPIFEQGEEVKN